MMSAMPDDERLLDVARRIVGPGAIDALERLSTRDVHDFISLLRLVKAGDAQNLSAVAQAAVAISPQMAQTFVDIVRRTLVYAEYPELAADPRFGEFWRASDRALRDL